MTVKKMHQDARNTVKAFAAAGIDVTVEYRKKHVHFMFKGASVYALSLGPKQPRRHAANLRRTIRRFSEGIDASHRKRFNRD